MLRTETRDLRGPSAGSLLKNWEARRRLNRTGAATLAASRSTQPTARPSLPPCGNTALAGRREGPLSLSLYAAYAHRPCVGRESRACNLKSARSATRRASSWRAAKLIRPVDLREHVARAPGLAITRNRRRPFDGARGRLMIRRPMHR